MNDLKSVFCRFCRMEVAAMTTHEALSGLNLHVQFEHPRQWEEIAKWLTETTAVLKTYTDVVADQEGVWAEAGGSANDEPPVSGEEPKPKGGVLI